MKKTNTNSTLRTLDFTIFSIIILIVGFFIYTKVIATNEPPASPENLGPAEMTDGTLEAREQPSLSFTLSDEDSESVGYRIQFSNTTDFSNIILDYTAQQGPSGDFTYTVGDTEEQAIYTVGSEGMFLENGPYFWRVRGIDMEGLTSEWVNAGAEGGVAFVVGGDDSVGPIITNLSDDISENSVTVRWTTDESSRTGFEFGTSEDSVVGVNMGTSLSLDHSVEINNLVSCTTYFYTYFSEDIFGNRSEGQELTKFFTPGCAGEADIIDDEVVRIDKDTGGTLSLTSGQYGLSLSVPVNFSDADHDFQIEKLTKTEVFNTVSKPSGFSEVGDYVYNLHALEDTATATSMFDEPITVTISYADVDIDGLDEQTFKIYRIEDGEEDWVELSNCSVDTADKEVSCQTENFSTFSLFGQEATVVVSSGGGHGGAVIIVPAPSNNQIVQANSETVPNQNIETPSPAADTATSNTNQTFSTNLSFGIASTDVKKLQQYLNSHGFILDSSGAGSTGQETTFFGPKTKQALIKFQEEYAEFILKPYGLTKGTGFFGEKTREYINSH